MYLSFDFIENSSKVILESRVTLINQSITEIDVYNVKKSIELKDNKNGN
jgi:hypothetical protein